MSYCYSFSNGFTRSAMWKFEGLMVHVVTVSAQEKIWKKQRSSCHLDSAFYPSGEWKVRHLFSFRETSVRTIEFLTLQGLRFLLAERRFLLLTIIIKTIFWTLNFPAYYASRPLISPRYWEKSSHLTLSPNDRTSSPHTSRPVGDEILHRTPSNSDRDSITLLETRTYLDNQRSCRPMVPMRRACVLKLLHLALHMLGTGRTQPGSSSVWIINQSVRWSDARTNCPGDPAIVGPSIVLTTHRMNKTILPNGMDSLWRGRGMQSSPAN